MLEPHSQSRFRARFRSKQPFGFDLEAIEHNIGRSSVFTMRCGTRIKCDGTLELHGTQYFNYMGRNTSITCDGILQLHGAEYFNYMGRDTSIT